MPLQQLLSTGPKVTRDAFLYLEAKGQPKTFAQCKSCAFFGATKLCGIMGRIVSPEGSCGLYAQGDRIGKAFASYTPKDVGYVIEQVRCENCRWGGKECGLYKRLNAAQPQVFALDTKIRPDGCCNAFKPKGR